MTLSSTLDRYREVYWHPRLFERGFAPRGDHRGRSNLPERAKHQVGTLVARHEYALPAEQARDIESIWQRAQAALS